MRTALAAAALTGLAFSIASAACPVNQFATKDGSCVASCPSGYFGQTSTHLCKPCYNTGYAKCRDGRPSSATKCATGYYLVGGRCMPADKVPAGAYGAANGVLVSCGTGVEKCSAAGISACKTGYALSSDGKHCTISSITSSAPASTPTAGGCPTNGVCDASGKLTSCTSGTYAAEGKCATSCPAGYTPYWPPDTQFRNKSPSNDYTCAACDINHHATECWQDFGGVINACEEGFKLDDLTYTCQQVCGEGTWADPATKNSNGVAHMNGCPAGQWIWATLTTSPSTMTREQCAYSSQPCNCVDCSSSAYGHHDGWRSATCNDFTGTAVTCKDNFTLGSDGFCH
ncbi:hypothetical protein JCM10207_008580 [Rhodosporidiobolus poonsookiae]